MGKHFGNLQRLKGVTYYVLSPNEVKPFTGIFSPGIANTFRRISENILPIGIPVLTFYLLNSYVISEFHKSQRKNVDEFKDDE